MHTENGELPGESPPVSVRLVPAWLGKFRTFLNSRCFYYDSGRWGPAARSFASAGDHSRFPSILRRPAELYHAKLSQQLLHANRSRRALTRQPCMEFSGLITFHMTRSASTICKFACVKHPTCMKSPVVALGTKRTPLIVLHMYVHIQCIH